MTNEELQRLAVELAGLDRSNDSSRVRTIESEIADYELGFLKSINGKAYFPLLKKHNGKIDYEVFWDVLIRILIDLLKNYDPEKATFITALSNLINVRVYDCFNMPDNQSIERTFTDLEVTVENGKIKPFDPDDFVPIGRPVEEESEFDIFLRIAPLVSLRKAQEKHLSKSKKSYFEGFFTFDSTNLVKCKLIDASDVVSENSVLFPIMEIVVLEYLLYGTFRSMNDVVNNAVRDEALLRLRNETIQVCYGLSKPTVVARNKLYRQLFDAVQI